jgi:uroporphyrinogen III methyltransferase/synthase
MKTARDKRRGVVYLVGAGPGRADLITVRGAEVLKTADCVIYDKLANPALLKFARKGAEIIHVPKRIGPGSFTQQEINKVLIEKASSGKTVVRLKGGDPCVFGRCTEEALLCAEAGIDFEIVPGVTAAIAAAGYTGIMLTDREYSSQVVFVTGREAEGKEQSNIDWNWLAKFGGTIVFYMGVGNLAAIAEQLIANGMAETTPAAVIADATFPSQRVVKASLARLSDACKKEQVEPPAIIVIGGAADSDARLNWFMAKPLFGKSIVVTRDVQGNAKFAARIIQQAGNPIEFPTIEIRPLTQAKKFLQALANFAEYDWVIFTSANGVITFFDCLRQLGKDSRVFGSAKIAGIGSETAAKLAEFGIKADLVPDVFTSEELGRQLLKTANLRDREVLLLRSQLASKQLPDLLEQGGAKVDDVPVYDIETVTGQSAWLVEKIAQGKIDWLTFASPSSANAFFEQIPPDSVNSSAVKVASIGPVTSEELRSLGAKVDVEANEHTIDGLLSAMELSEKRVS